MVVVLNGKDCTVYHVDNTLVIDSNLAVVGNGSHSRTTHERTVYDCHTGPRLVQILTLVCQQSVTLVSILTRMYKEYSFAKYNVQSTNYIYSQDEYNRFLEGEAFIPRE